MFKFSNFSACNEKKKKKFDHENMEKNTLCHSLLNISILKQHTESGWVRKSPKSCLRNI